MAMHKIIPLTTKEQAELYPYEAPASSYVIEKGYVRLIETAQVPDLTGKTAVLSIGSNRAPQQLLRKFGDEAELIVTTALLKDCDVVHSACFSYYGAVPCTAYPCQGTDITLNAVWLTDAQLQIMHDTEAVGIAYDYCQWNDGHIVIDVRDQPQAVFGYATRLGYFANPQGLPYALSSLPAHNRQFDTLSQQQARQWLRAQLPVELQMADEADFMIKIVADKPFRLAVNEALKLQAKQMPKGPWQIKKAVPVDAETYL